MRLPQLERVGVVTGTPGFVALWDFVRREPGRQRRFTAHVPAGAGNEFPLDAGNYVQSPAPPSLPLFPTALRYALPTSFGVGERDLGVSRGAACRGRCREGAAAGVTGCACRRWRGKTKG